METYSRITGSENSKKNGKKDNQSSGSEVTEGQRDQDRKIDLIKKQQPNLQLPEEQTLLHGRQDLQHFIQGRSGIESTGMEQMMEQEGGVCSHIQEFGSKYIQMKKDVSMLEESHRQMLSSLDTVEERYPKLRETVAAQKELQGTNIEMGNAGTNTEMGMAGTNIEMGNAGTNTEMGMAEKDIQELVTSVESFNEKLKTLLQDNSDGHNDITLSTIFEELSLEQLKATRKDLSQICGHVTVYLESRSSQVGMFSDETIKDQTVNVYDLPEYVPKYLLTKSHKMFSRTLKRRNTLRSHDNRIALHYDIETVEGCVTHSGQEEKDKKDEDSGVASACDMGIRAGETYQNLEGKKKSVDERTKEVDHKKVTGNRNQATDSKGLAKKGTVWKRGTFVGAVDENEGSKSKTTTESSDTNSSHKEHEESYKNCFFDSIPLALVAVDKVRAQGYQVKEDQEINLVDGAYWTQCLQEAVSKGSHVKTSRGTGFDTVLLLDISASMGKERWIQTITFLQNFLDGIQSSQNYLTAAFEYISLVVFGHETRVVQHLTCDYVSLRKNLDSLYPNGPSPLAAGVAMSRAALEAAGHVYSCRGVTVYPRIVLVTDGRPTDTFKIAGPDIASNDEQEQERQRVLNMFKTLREELNIRVFPVPVGDSDKEFLQMIASATNGKVVSPVNWRKLTNYQKQVDICCKLSQKKMNPLLYALYRVRIEDAEDASSADMEEAEELLQEHRERKREAKEEEDEETEFIERDPNMPPLGTRVARGPNWCWDNQDSSGFGTVIGHWPNDLKGWISVKWDQKNPSGCDEYNYRYGADGAYDILPVNDFRLLQLQEKIAVGCIVQRGKDWKGENQDGGSGNTGVVLKVYKKGVVKVRWENGMKGNYRFGSDEKYDVELCNSFEARSFLEGGPLKNPSSSPSKNPSNTPEKEKSNIPSKSVSTLENPHSTSVPTRSGKSAPAMGKNLVPTKRTVPQPSLGKNTTKQLSDIGAKAKEVPSLQEEDKTEPVQQHKQDLKKVKEEVSKRASNRVTGDSRTAGAILESNDQSPFVQLSDKMTDHSVVWQWRNPSGHWVSYDQDICQQLESRFQKNPHSSITIYHQNQIYRVVFSRMQLLNTNTKEWTDVQRLS